MEFPTIRDFKEFLLDYAHKYGRYEYVNPLYNKRKKPDSFKVIYLKIGNRYNLFHIYDHTHIYALKELGHFLDDYLDGLYPELKAPFNFESTKQGKLLNPLGLKKIPNLYIYWAGKAVDPDKGIF